METTTPLGDLTRLCAERSDLTPADVPAAEALVAAMAGWHAADLAAYRASVLDEVAKIQRSGRPARGFLAVELAALAQVEAHAG